MRLGVRAHDFGKLPVCELADRIAAKGFVCVQLAPTKAIAGFDDDDGRLSPGFAWQARRAFEKREIQIAVLGCYINLADPDAGRRARSLARFKEYIRHARDFGCSVVGTETGSLNRDFTFHPGNRGEEAFGAVRDGVRELVREAEKFGVFVGIEGVAHYVVSDVARLRRLVEEVDSGNLRIIFDPVNLLSPENHHHQEAIMREAFDRLGDRIAIVHAKDFLVEGDRLRSVPSGQGRLRHELLLALAQGRKPEISFLMEDTNPETVDASAQFLRNLDRTAPRGR